MTPPSESPRDERLPTVVRRRAIRLAYANAALWAVGNGLVSSTLVIFLALDLGASGFQAGLIYAAPFFAGLLRLAVPSVLARLRRRKAFCIAAYLASAAVLSTVPLAAVPQLFGENRDALILLVFAWCTYHVLEYSGTVTLWSWLGDLVPRRVRGRFCGRRERWLVNGRIVGLVASVLLASLAMWLRPEAPRWQPLAVSAALGALFMVLAVLPLAWMPGVEAAPSAVPRTPWRAIARAMVTRPYRQLVLFSTVFSLVNGFTAAAQATFPRRILDISYEQMQSLIAMMRVGQTALAPTMGRWCDRFGCRPVMIVSQLIVATGPLFLLVATPVQPWWIVGAYVAWIAYAGMNVGIDTVKLKLAPQDNTAPCLAVYYAVGDLGFGTATVLGGLLFDRLVERGIEAADVYAAFFVAGWLGRTLVVALLAPLEEPGAQRLRDIVNRAAAGSTR
jgi:MFS family permease